MAKIARVWNGTEWVVLSPAAINPYPEQDGAAGRVLGTDGSSVSWVTTPFAYSSLDSHWTTSDNINLLNSVIKFNGTQVLSASQYSGNAATVTNGVYTNTSYSDPSWIQSISWNKITSTPTTLDGYGIHSVAWNKITSTPTTLDGYGIQSVAWSKVTSTPTTLSGYGIDVNNARTSLSINNVENTALSTWAGSTNITTLGTINTGVWQGSVIAASYIHEDIARDSELQSSVTSLQNQINNKLDSSTAASTYSPIASPTFTGTVTLPSTTSIGDVSSTEIGYVNGVTSAIQTQLDAKAPLASPTFTGTVSGITKSMVGLGNVDDTSDANKPISTAQQSALDLKSNLSGATFTGFITLHADPTQAMHAATKQYVDETSEGLQTKPSVEIATTANLTATYSNGTNGVGATLTATSNGAFPQIDGITLSSTTPGQNGVLVKNQTNSAQNGRYNLTQVGNGSTPWVLTRCGLCDQADEIPGAYIFVKRGTLNAGSGWTLIVSDPTTFVVGTDSISAFQFSGAGTITAGTNVSVNGSQVSVINNPTFSGLVTASSGIAFSDGTQTKQGVPSISSFVSKTASYTLDDLTLRDNIIEVDSVSATTVTIPPDSSLNFPVGASLDVIQINTGEVTIAAGAGVTVNATPGLKLRTRWSSCTLLKRSSNSWIVYGDLKA